VYLLEQNSWNLLRHWLSVRRMQTDADGRNRQEKNDELKGFIALQSPQK
jgi:hypothetical protein